MIDRRLHDLVDDFLSTNRRSAWLNGDYLCVYLRQNRRALPQDGAPPETAATQTAATRPCDALPRLTPCIDLANTSDMAAQYRGQGLFSGFVAHLESKQTTIYVENIGPIWLRQYFLQRGYQRRAELLDWCCYRRAGE